MRSLPITVVATSAGCNFAYAAVRNAGFQVSKLYSVESDEKCRRITETIVPAAELQHIGHHTEQVGNQIDDVHVDLFTDRSPCQPWSRCNGLNAKGFKDSRAATFEHANELYLRLKPNNPAIKRIVENVVPARHLKKDQETMATMRDSKFHEVNASQWGAGHSRPRNVATNICNISDIPDQRCSDPNSFISDDVYCKGQTVNCIVASDANTHNPATVFSRKNNTERLITVAEAESLLLHVVA